MDFRILGPLEVRGELGAVALGGSKPRAVLAMLLLHANEPVSAERLALALWGEEAPRDAVRTVRVHVSRLRKALGDPDIVSTTPAGYCLHVGPDELDATRFERLAQEGRRALAAGRASQAAAALNEALTLWRGPPLADLAYEPFAQAEIARLEDQRLAALEARLEADLAAGSHGAVLAELQQLGAAHPTRERLAGLLMVALYRCGRQADALEAYATAREKLVDQVGLEPGPELRRLQRAVLTHDPSLELDVWEDDLPPALDSTAAPALVGREPDLGWLAERWVRAQAGAGALVTVIGAAGMGKTRLAAELAVAARRLGGKVLYAAGTGPRAAVLAALSRASGATGPTLLVVDDADRADPGARAALAELAGAAPGLPLLVLATGEDADALAELHAESVVMLQPLDLAAVSEIAGLYAPSHPSEPVPDAWLRDAAEGRPRRVHELASQWARRAAARRVGTAAERAAEGRTQLRAMETELAGGVLELQAATDRAAPLDDDAITVTCPFRGLAPFEVADAPFFFGREGLIAELVAQLVGTPLLGIVGASGSGKSSVLRAGLLPALASGVLPRSDEWAQVLMRPGAHPLDELRSACEAVERDRPCVLAVDQFEEAFTVCHDDDERGAFVAELVRAATRRAPRTTVVLAIRADCYGSCAEHPELASLLAGHNVLVGAMQHDELRRAVERPAQRAGLRVEDGLVDTLVADVEAQPGALPLLSTALLQLWQRRDGRRLTLAAYEHTGGVRGAVARLAEDAFCGLDAARQQLARGLLLRLVDVDDEGRVERRRVALAELGPEVSSAIGPLAAGRLLTVGEGAVELAHEALLREWPRLAAWIDEDRECLRVRRRLRAAAQEWLRLDHDADVLYRGARLAEARDWQQRGVLGVTEAERFLEASEEREAHARRSRRRRLALAFASLALAVVVIGVIAVVALHQRSVADSERTVALSRALAGQSESSLDADPELGLRLALWAVDTSPTPQAVGALRQADLAFRQVGVVDADPVRALAAAYSPDGTRILTGGDRGVAYVWDAAMRRPLARLATGHGSILAARYSRSGDRIALGFRDGTLLVCDGSLGAPRTVLRRKDWPIRGVALSADGSRVAAAVDDGTVRILALNGSAPEVTLRANADGLNGVDISPDASSVASAGEDGTVRLWHLADPSRTRVLATAGAPMTAVRFSPDGKRILAVGFDGRVRLWNARTEAVERTLSGEGRELRAAAFSADGRRFAAAGTDGVVRVWSLVGGSVAALHGQRSGIFDVGFAPSGDRLASAGDDGTVRMWDAGAVRSWTLPGVNRNIDLDRDGRLLTSGADDGTVRVWDTAAGRVRARLPGAAGYTTSRFSPAADMLVIGRSVGVSVSLVSGGRVRIVAPVSSDAGIASAHFDSAGSRVVYAEGLGGAIAVEDLRTRRRTRLAGGPETVVDAQLSPDGEHVAAADDVGDLAIWRLDHPARPRRTLKAHHGDVDSIAFSSDGRLATAGADRTIRVSTLRGGPTVVLRGHSDEVTAAVFTADGKRILSSSRDGSVRLWDARGGEALATLQSTGTPVIDVVASPDGTIASLDQDGTVRVFRCQVCGSLRELRALARSRAPRALTPDERQWFLSDVR